MREAIRAKGRGIGFDKIGFAPAKIPEQEPRLAEWLRRGYHGEMRWMMHDPARRTDGSRSLSGAATLVCCALNYYQGEPPPTSSLEGVISTYACGDDYHRVLEAKLRTLADFISWNFDLPTKIYVDMRLDGDKNRPNGRSNTAKSPKPGRWMATETKLLQWW